MDLVGEFHPPSSKGNSCLYVNRIHFLHLNQEQINRRNCKSLEKSIAFPFSVSRNWSLITGWNLKMIYFPGLQRKIYSPPYRPQSNGCIEGIYKFLKNCLAKYITRHRGSDNVVPIAAASYNLLPNQHSKESLFFIMFGRDALTN